ncbi:MAG: hypothetical protein ACXQTP_07050 [Candidatus Methanofastidiosia archaeon]
MWQKYKTLGICVILIFSCLSLCEAGNRRVGNYLESKDSLHLHLSVNREIKVDNCGNYYEITTILRGKNIEKKLGVKEIYKKETSLDRPALSETKEDVEVDIIDPYVELPKGSDIPKWTYDAYFSPFLTFMVFVKADPVNLVFSAPSPRMINSSLTSNGWKSTDTWNILQANVNFIPYNGRWIPQSKNFFFPRFNGERFHLRIWNLDNIVIGQAHIDTQIPHMAYLYETAERTVARAFPDFLIKRNSIWLGNPCFDEKRYFSNGWATFIMAKHL